MVAIPLNCWSWHRCLSCQLLTTRMLRSVSDLGCIPLNRESQGRQGKQAKRFSGMSEKEPLLERVAGAIKGESLEWGILRTSGWDLMHRPSFLHFISSYVKLRWIITISCESQRKNSVLWLKSRLNPRPVRYYPCKFLPMGLCSKNASNGRTADMMWPPLSPSSQKCVVILLSQPGTVFIVTLTGFGIT